MAYFHSKRLDIRKIMNHFPLSGEELIKSTEADRDIDEDETIFMINGKTSSLQIKLNISEKLSMKKKKKIVYAGKFSQKDRTVTLVDPEAAH